jgi:hypothetical protein
MRMWTVLHWKELCDLYISASIVMWDLDGQRDNHVYYNKYLLLFEYHSWSGKLSGSEEHCKGLAVASSSSGEHTFVVG